MSTHPGHRAVPQPCPRCTGLGDAHYLTCPTLRRQGIPAARREEAMNNTQAPAPQGLGIGDEIEHDLMPGFVMKIQGVGPCETDGARPEKHSTFKITDPEGEEDWLCGYDVHPVGAYGVHITRPAGT